jgi:hypothetical protein
MFFQIFSGAIVERDVDAQLPPAPPSANNDSGGRVSKFRQARI